MKWLVEVGPQEPVCAAAWRSLSPRLKAVRKNLRKAADDSDENAEYVHQLRVAARRADAALDVYSDLLPKKEHSWWKKWLKLIRKTAGEARDADVLSDYFAKLPAGLLHDIAKKHLANERAMAQDPIWDAADRFEAKKRWRRHGKRLKRHLLNQDCNEAELSQPFGPWASQQLKPLVQAIWEAVPAANAEHPQLHQFRIETKKLRYAIELLGSVFPPELRTVALPRLEDIQQMLGEINDSVGRERRLATWRAEFDDAELDRQIHELQQQQQARATELRCKFEDWWAAEVGSLHRVLDDI